MNKTEILNRIEKDEEAVKKQIQYFKTIENELKGFKEQLKNCADDESKFERVKEGKEYFTIQGDCLGILVASYSETGTEFDKKCFKSNNYFYTEERAQQVVDKINFLLKLERFHDIYCPDYEPNWNDPNENKYCIYYNCNAKEYNCIYNHSAVKMAKVYFPTEEIAQKVCDILNEELENNE